MKVIAWLLFSIVLVVVFAARVALGVQPFPGGVRINWERLTNDLSYFVWRMNPPSTNWQYLGSTTNTTFLYTNFFPDGTMFGVTANQRMTNGICCVAADVGVAGWPPAIGTPQKTVKLTPMGGYTVRTGQWVKASSDLKTWDDWVRFRIAGTNVQMDHLASPIKPHLFLMYPTNPIPPFP